MRPRPLTIALLVAGLVPAAGSAQRTPVFSARSELVVLHVRVEDRAGRAVSGLTADDFEITEDGRRQTIAFFEAQDAPATIGLIVDSSGSMRPVRDAVLAAAARFVTSSHPQDELFALVFNERVRAVLDGESFTTDAAVLDTALDRALIAGGQTALYDAIAAGLEYAARGRYQRQVLVLVADGADNASAMTLEQTRRQIEQANTLIYAVALADRNDRDSDVRRLGQLARLTGGEAFAPKNDAEITEAFQHIARDIRSVYTIGYTPAPGGDARAFQPISVKLPGIRGVRVRTRTGYRVSEEAP